MKQTVEVYCSSGCVALPRRYGTGPAGVPLVLTSDPKHARRLPLDGFVRRQLRRGVFVEQTPSSRGKPKEKAK